MSVYYTKEHEWVRVEGDTRHGRHHRFRAGGSWATSSSSRCPRPGRALSQGRRGGGGRIGQGGVGRLCAGRRQVTEGNQAVADEPALVNTDPEGEGWFFKLKLDDPARARRADGRSRLSRLGEDALTDGHRLDQPAGTRPIMRGTARFVPALGEAALELLDPQPGELILDVGCGDGALTAADRRARART